ncbi:MAG: mdeA 2 [Firmicutes bacterium]|nr:mdeA 2 [Bacillota bacterium]
MAQEQFAFDTLKVRGGYNPKEHNNASSVPIYQTASYELGDTERVARLFSFSELGYLYTRIGNPTVAVLEQRLAALDGASGALAVASGMAAVTYTLLNLTEGGGRILTTPQLYGGTYDSFKKVYATFGVGIDLVLDPTDLDQFRKAIRPETRAIYVESISNPNAVVADIEALANLAHEYNIPLVVDNTVATPYLFNPLRYGADIVVYSATKALGGHGNAIAGLIVESGKFNWGSGKFPQFLQPHYTLRDAGGKERSILEVFPDAPFTFRVRLNYLAYFGAALSPSDAYLILLGVETLSERVQKQVANTEKIVAYLETQPGVSWVKHPSAKASPYRRLAQKYLTKGAGSLLSFGFNGTSEQLNLFIDSVRLFSYQANIGDAKSLIINSPKTTHGELTAEEQRLADISPETIRLSIGLEDPDDLIRDLQQAFDKALAV